MDRTHFTANATGTLVQIDRADHPQRKDWAFVPDDLPPPWVFDPALWPRLAEARERLGTLNGIGQTLPDSDLLLHPLQNREAIASSRIEGTFVTPEQLLLFEIDPQEPGSARDERAAWMEVFNYSDTLRVGCEMLDQNHPIGSHFIRSLHSILMRGVRGRDRAPGQFRQKQVQIGSTARYIPPPPAEIDRLMENLEAFIAAEGDGWDPLVKCCIVHYQFEAIHPFEDGNGRVGRALLALMIYKLFGHKRPWLYLSAYYDRFQDEYVRKMFQVSAAGRWSEWIDYCLNGTIIQANDSIRRCDQFRALKDAYHQRVPASKPRAYALIDSLFRYPILRVSSVQKQLGIHYVTAKGDIDTLVALGILKELPGHHPKTFFAPGIMEIAYGRESSL